MQGAGIGQVIWSRRFGAAARQGEVGCESPVASGAGSRRPLPAAPQAMSISPRPGVVVGPKRRLVLAILIACLERHARIAVAGPGSLFRLIPRRLLDVRQATAMSRRRVAPARALC
jgi:hypothetical protein